MADVQVDEGSESYDSDSYDESYDSAEERVSEEPESVFSPRGEREHNLEVKNAQIANTVKGLTVNNLTPATKRKLTQQEQLLKAEQEAESVKKPVWLEQAARRRASGIQRLEERREKGISSQAQERPEWVQKAKEAQISRDLRGLDRFLNQKAPALPAEPEWFSKACKRRDLTQLLEVEERAHESNKETPEWASSAQKILNSFLQDDEGVLPDWMKKGVQMTKDEKNEMMEQLQQLRQLLLEEQKLTAERETLLASCKDSLSSAQQRLEESVGAFRTLRENRKDTTDNVQCFVDSTNQVFERNSNWMKKVKDQFEIHEQVQALVERQQEKEQVRRENRQAATKSKKKPKKSKKKPVKSESTTVGDASQSESANEAAVTESPRKKKSKKSSGADLRKKTRKNASENTS